MIQKIQRMSVDPLASFYRKVSKNQKSSVINLSAATNFNRKYSTVPFFFKKNPKLWKKLSPHDSLHNSTKSISDVFLILMRLYICS